MKFLLGLVALAFFGAVAEAKRSQGAGNDVRDAMLQSNRPSKSSSQAVREALTSSVCDDCKDVVGVIGEYSRDPEYVELAQDAIKSFCRFFFEGDDLNACIQLADGLPGIIAQLRPLLDDPARSCRMVDLCGAQTSRVNRILFMALKRQVLKRTLSPAQNNALCDECQLGVRELKTLWDTKSIQQSVEDWAKGLCAQLGDYADTCKDVVDQYWGTFVEYVDDELKDAKAVCSSIGLCSTRMVTVRGQRLRPASATSLRIHVPQSSAFRRLVLRLRQTQMASGAAVGCTVCRLAFSTVQTVLLQNSVLDGIASEVETRVEALLPAAYKGPVQDFLSIYLVPVLNLAVRQITPREACDALKACDSADAALLGEAELAQLSATARGDVVCDACKLLSEALVGELSQADVQKELTQEILQVCDYVPGAYVDECDNLIKENAPAVFKDLIDELSPDSLCPKLHLCPKRRLVGRRPNGQGMQDERGF